MSKNRTMRRSLAALCLLGAVAPVSVGHTAPASPSFTKLNARVIDTYVIPGFTKLAKASGKLAENLSRTCEGNAKAAKAVRKDFADTVLAWAAVEFLRFGPMSLIGRPERFDFWPDPRGVTQRQVAALITKRDATALDPALLAKKSAAVQGLSALEVLLDDGAPPLTGTDEASVYRCKLAVSMAQSTHALAHEILSEWEGDTGWRQRMVEPGAADARYKTPEEPAGDFARALITGLQMVQDREVVPMIAVLQTPHKEPRLPFLRSDLSARYISAGIASIKSLYDTMGLGRGVPSEKAWMPRWVTAAFERLARDAPAAVEGIPQAKNNPDRARQLRMVRFHVEGIRKLIGRELAPLAGLTIGFNELDGD
jgi:predicted lipoprotein